MGWMMGTELASHPDRVTPHLLANTAGDQQKQEKVTQTDIVPSLLLGGQCHRHWGANCCWGRKPWCTGDAGLVQRGAGAWAAASHPESTDIYISVYIYTLYLYIYI